MDVEEYLKQFEIRNEIIWSDGLIKLLGGNNKTTILRLQISYRVNTCNRMIELERMNYQGQVIYAVYVPEINVVYLNVNIDTEYEIAYRSTKWNR